MNKSFGFKFRLHQKNFWCLSLNIKNDHYKVDIKDFKSIACPYIKKKLDPKTFVGLNKLTITLELI